MHPMLSSLNLVGTSLSKNWEESRGAAMSCATSRPLIRVVLRSVNSPMSRRSQAFSQAASEAAMNSASQVDIAVEDCSRERQEMGPPREKKT